MPAGPGIAMASKKTPIFGRIKFGEIIKTFGEAAALGISPQHPEAFLRKVDWNDQDECFYATLSEPGGDLMTLSFTPGLLLSNILPNNRLHKQCGYQTQDFLEKYWEPIIHAVGHYYNEANQSVLVPEHSKSKRFLISGFRSDTKETIVARIQSVGSMGKKSWLIKSSQSVENFQPPSEDRFQNAQVRCIKRDLPTYVGRTGIVIKTLARADYIDVIVDFGRGLDSLVLTDNDVEIVGELKPQHA